MGVQGLWELLAPVGRRVSVETLAGKKLAIDASIWMVQFIKAMRDEKGEMVRNAHLIGFFRRICKLLYLRTKPVFVFDGGTPALKRRTVAARRRHRDNARAKIRKMAEKLLLKNFAKRRLEDVAEDIRNGGEKNDLKGKKVLSDRVGVEGSSAGLSDHRVQLGASMESLDELLAASLAAEEGTAAFDRSAAVVTGRDGSYEEEENDSDDEEMILPIGSGNIDPAVLVSLPPSMQLDLLVQMREKVMAENRQKYQKIKKAPSKFSELQIQSYLKTVAFRREIDEVQKSAAGRGVGGVQSSRIASEANREFIFSSSFTGDKQVFTSKELPKDGYGDKCPSDKPTTSSVSCSPITFQSKSSKEASISQLMKEVAPDVETYCDERGRVRVNRVRGLGINMTRDLQRNLDLMKEYELENTCADSNKDPKTMNSKGVSIVLDDAFEAGHVSSVATNENHRTISSGTEPFKSDLNSSEPSLLDRKDAIQISFLEDDSEMIDADDNIFLELASRSSKTDLPMQTIPLDRVTSDSETECDWEEGPVLQDVKDYAGPGVETAGDRKYDNKENQTSLSEAINNEGDDVEWEEGDCQNFEAEPGQQDDPGELVSIGLLEEEAEIQEAIKRSLADFKQQMLPSSVNLTSKSTEDQSCIFLDRPKNLADSIVLSENNLDRSPLLLPIGISSQKSVLQIPGSSSKQFDPSSSHAVSLHIESSEKNGIRYEESPVTPQTNNRLVKLVDDSLHQKEQFGVTVNLKNESRQKVSPLDSPLCLKELSDISVSVSNESCSGVKQNSTSGCQKEQCDVRETVCSDSFGISSDVCIPSPNCAVEAPVDVKQDDEASRSSFLAGSGYLGTAGNSYMANFEEEQQQTVDKNEIILDDNRVQGRTQMTLDNEMEAQTAKLEEEISLLGRECADIGNEQRKLERNAESVSSEMFAECQELLQMFGLPYIIAPMEAEAQCAFMEITNLVDGVVTDDSDVFLFGARSVYKNIFDDRKYVETYFMKDIESELGLTREKLVHVAMLLGSDYTEGVSGIGIVNAIEVVHAFPEEDGLKKFREWVESPDPTILGKFDSKRKTLKEKNGDDMLSNLEENTSAAIDSRDDQTSANNEKVKATFMSKHRNMSKNWHIPPSFPSDLVINAYRSPQVDESTETFSWGKPDLLLLRKLCWEKFGWTSKKADELLVPVLEEYNKRETQLRLEAFYTFNERFAKIRSQRIKKALKGITGNLSSDIVSDHAEDVSSDRKSKRRSPKVKQPEPPSSNIKHKKGKCVTENSSHQKNKRQKVNIDVVDCHEDDDTLSGAKIKGRRGRGRGSRRGGGRGNRICSTDNSRAKLNSESTDASISDDSDVIGQTEDLTKVVPELRRSSRKHRQVNYAEEAEPGESKDSLDQVGRNEPEEVAEQQELVEDYRDEDSVTLDRRLHQFPEASSSKDYLLSGGGFCADEDDEQSNAVQQMDGEPLVNGGSSSEYLLSGGGFCEDETDKQTDTIQPSSSPTNITVQPAVAPKFNEPDMIAVSRDTSSSLNAKAKHALSAMPTLRRKRRKL